MRKTFLLLLLGLVCSIGNAWGDDATFDGTNLNVSSSNKKVGKITLSSSEMTYDSGLKASSSNKTFTLTPDDGYNISLVKITMSGSSNRYTSSNITNCTSATRDGSVYTCEISKGDVALNFKNSGGGVTITKIVVTYASASPNPTLSGTSSPAASATGVAVSGSGYLKFNKNLNSVDKDKITISPNSNGEALSSIAVDGSDASKVNYSWSGLQKETQYTINIAADAVSDGTYTNAAASLSFTTVTKTALTAEWSNSAPIYEVGSASTIPTFTVTGGTLGTDYSVAYTKVSGDNLATFTAGGGITAIATGTAGTETIKATVTILNSADYKMATTEYSVVITVANTHTVTYDGNGADSGTAPTDATAYAEGASVAVADNFGSLTKAGYSVVGWNTNPDATTTSHAFGSSFDMGDDDVTLYAIWQENYCNLVPASSGSTINANDVIDVQSGSFGGSMKFTPSGDGSTLEYNSNGLKFGSSSKCIVTIELNDFMKAGTVITATFWNNDSKTNRGVDILNAAGTDKGDWYFTGDSKIHAFTYIVTSGDGFIDTKSFKLKRKGDAYLKSLSVTNAQPGGVISATGWSTYSSSKPLNLNSLSAEHEVAAYVATAAGDGKVTLTSTDAKVPAGTGLMIKGTAGDAFTINVTSESTTAPAKNYLVAGTGAAVAHNANGNDYNYVLVANAGVAEFQRIVDGKPATVLVGKAYLSLPSMPASAPSLLRIVEEENNTTSVETIESAEQVTKFFENGNLYILRDGIIYDVTGRMVK